MSDDGAKSAPWDKLIRAGHEPRGRVPALDGRVLITEFIAQDENVVVLLAIYKTKKIAIKRFNCSF